MISGQWPRADLHVATDESDAPAKASAAHSVASDPVILADAVTELLDRLELADLQLELRKQWWHDGYAAGRRSRDNDYEAGYAQAVADLKHALHDTYKLVNRSAPLWAAHYKSSRDGAA